jgi:tRNA-specific 2-thiouridylase
MRIAAKARSRMQEQPATVYPLEDGSVRVEFDQPQRALTPGQAVVFYDGDTVVGGGTITKVL